MQMRYFRTRSMNENDANVHVGSGVPSRNASLAVGGVDANAGTDASADGLRNADESSSWSSPLPCWRQRRVVGGALTERQLQQKQKLPMSYRRRERRFAE